MALWREVKFMIACAFMMPMLILMGSAAVLIALSAPFAWIAEWFLKGSE